MREFWDALNSPLPKLPIDQWLKNGILAVVNSITDVMPELTTLAIVLFAFGWMLTGDGNKWGGRVALAFFIGTAWMIIAKGV